MGEISSSLSSENVARFVCDSRPLSCRSSRTSKEARRSGISTMSMVARIAASKTFQESDLLLRSVRMVSATQSYKYSANMVASQNLYRCAVGLFTTSDPVLMHLIIDVGRNGLREAFQYLVVAASIAHHDCRDGKQHLMRRESRTR
jgi:hypothetical protein